MANIDKTDFRWNGKLSGAVNLLYSDLINVDVVKPPYSWSNRNSSFFLQTRLGYIAESALSLYIHSYYPSFWTERWVEDIEVIWDTNCEEEEWDVWIMVSKTGTRQRVILTWRIENWCFDTNSLREPLVLEEYDSCWCWDMRFFKTNHPRWDRIQVTSSWDWGDWIQVNVLEGWVYRWYFTTKWILDWTDSWTWTVKAWDYLVINQSSDVDWSWFAWQIRMVTWYSSDNKYLVLDNAWNWFAVADENWNTYRRVQWWDLDYTVYRDEWEVIWMTTWSAIYVYTGWNNWTDRLVYRPTNWCIISTTESNGRLFALYNNWYVRYSTIWWRDKFFFNDEMYAGNDKSSIYAYKDFVLAFGKRNMSVWVPTEYNNTIYYTMYSQSATIWLKSRFSYWEHDGNLIFVSNDNRLLALWVAATSWKYMLSFEDIGVEMINAKLATMLATDEAFIADYNNQLRVLVQTKSNPFDEATKKNSETHIYKFDNYFKIWTEDHLETILMRWYKCWIWYWEWWLYLRWVVQSRDWENFFPTLTWRVDEWYSLYNMDFRQTTLTSYSSATYKPNPVTARIWAFLIENEQTWMDWNPDLFNLAKLNRLIVTLGYWVYSENTKLRITSYREWIWEVTEITTIWNNDWAQLTSLSYTDSPIPEELQEKKQCLIDTIWESQSWYIQECTSWENKIQDLIIEHPWCESTRRTILSDHNICVDSSLYELAPHKPLVVGWIGSTQNYSSQIKLEIISKSWDLLNFGWFLAELFIAPIGDKWADWENLIEMSSC